MQDAYEQIDAGIEPRLDPPEVSQEPKARKVRSDKGTKRPVKDVPVQDARMIGIGGAPTRATTLPTDSAGRKRFPVATGVLDYFPDAIVEVSQVSHLGNEQHNPGQPLHWARTKSADESDTMIRHFLQRGTIDVDGQRHSAKMAWRALAILQKEIEAAQEAARG